MPEIKNIVKNFNMFTQQFLSNGSSYVKAEVKPDSFKNWEDPAALRNKRVKSDIAFLVALTVGYEKYGPIQWIGQTVPLFEPLDAEVGDDHTYLGDAPLMFVAELITVTDLYDVQVSEKDTFISSHYGNYSESYILKPDNISELYHPNIKSGEDLIFLDIAKIRTLLAVCSMRQKHSDTVDGKVSLLGKQAVYKTGLCGFEITVAQCVQQINLGLMKERKFPYVPTYLGGYGSPPIFSNTHSMIRCFESYRCGEYYNILAGICFAVSDTKKSGRLSSKRFLSTVKGCAESWQDWYKVYTKYLPQIKGDLDPKFYKPEFLIGTMGRNEIWDSAANRLLSAGMVCSKTQLMVHDHLEDLNTVLLSRYCSLETREVIEYEKSAQRQESVFNNHLKWDLDFILPSHLTDDLVQSLLDLSRTSNYHLKALLSSEDIFTRSALDSIKQKSPTIVNMQMITKRGLRYPLVFDLEIREEELPYYNSLLDFVNGEIGLDNVSRVLIEDDPVLVEIAKEWAYQSSLNPLKSVNLMVITTDDERLCKQINTLVPQIVVARISAKRTEKAIQNIKNSLKSSYLFADIRHYDDEGSLAHNKAKTAFVNSKSGWQKVKFVLGRKINPLKTDHRRLNEVRVTDLVIKPDGIFDQQGLLSHRYDVPRVTFKRTLKRFGYFDEYRLNPQDESDEEF